MSNDLARRVRRIYAAIKEVREEDLSQILPEVGRGTDFVSATIDFTGGRSEEKLENDLQTAISLLAHLPEHLKEFARRTTRDPR